MRRNSGPENPANHHNLRDIFAFAPNCEAAVRRVVHGPYPTGRAIDPPLANLAGRRKRQRHETSGQKDPATTTSWRQRTRQR